MKTVLITGGANGLGLAMTQRLLAQNCHVVVVDTDLRELPQNLTLTAVSGDITTAKTHAEILLALAGKHIDLLIHCAGVSATGPFQDIPIKNHVKVLDVNLTAPIALTVFLEYQNALSETASIAFISSLSHFTAYPGAACYAASKDGLVHFARSWGKAFPKHHVMRVFPGPLDTEHAKRYAPDNSEKSLKNRMSTDHAAQKILRAISRKRKICIPGVTAKLAAIMGTIAPRLTGRLMRKALLDKMDRVRT